MKKLVFIIVFILIAITFSSCKKEDTEKTVFPPAKVKIFEAGKMPFIEKISLTGTIKPKEKVSVKSLTHGKATSVFFELGDKVKRGQILAILDEGNKKSTTIKEHENAIKAYQTAENALRETLASSKEKIAQAELSEENARLSLENIIKENTQNISLAKTRLSNSRKSISLNVKTALTSVKQAETNLAYIKEETDKSLQNTLESADISIDSILLESDFNLENLNNILGVEDANREVNDYFEHVLSIRNPQYLIDAKTNYEYTVISYKKLIDSKSNTEEQLLKLISFLKKLKETANLTSLALKSTEATLEFPENELFSLQSNIINVRSKIVNNLNNSKTILQNIKNLKRNNRNKVKNAEIALEQSKNTLNQARQTEDNIENSIPVKESREMLNLALAHAKTAQDNAEKRLALASKSLKAVRFSSEIQVLSARSALNAAKRQFDLANISLDNLKILAPRSGYIINKNIVLGAEISAGKTIAEIAELKKVKIRVFAVRSDLKKIKKGQEATSTFLGIKGKITRISPAADSKSKKILIEAEFPNKNFLFIPETFMEIRLNYRHPKKEIFVPLNAVNIEKNKGILFILKEGKAVKKEVSIGEILENSVLISSGIKKGDKVIAGGVKDLAEGMEVKIFND